MSIRDRLNKNSWVFTLLTIVVLVIKILISL